MSRRSARATRVHAEVDEHYVPLRRTLRNEYLLDRDDQKHRSFTGIPGRVRQDASDPGQPGGRSLAKPGENLLGPPIWASCVRVVAS
jgi:hypothetical protein